MKTKLKQEATPNFVMKIKGGTALDHSDAFAMIRTIAPATENKYMLQKLNFIPYFAYKNPPTGNDSISLSCEDMVFVTMSPGWSAIKKFIRK